MSIIDDLCPPPPIKQNCKTDWVYHYAGETGTYARVGDSVVYTCSVGFRFPEGGSSRSVECLSGGVWNTFPRGCFSEYTFHVLLHNSSINRLLFSLSIYQIFSLYRYGMSRRRDILSRCNLPKVFQ